MRVTRRAFVASAAAIAATYTLRAETITAHSSVAEIEREHILASAKAALAVPTSPPALESLAAPWSTPATGDAYLPHTDALRHHSATVAALTAAFLLTHDGLYANHAATHIQNWLTLKGINDLGGPYTSLAHTKLAARDQVLDLLPFAELSRAACLLAGTLAPATLAAIQAVLAALLNLLNTDPNAQLARDSKDHLASAWLLTAAACARATRNEPELDKLRLRFKKPTLRNHISLEGKFPQELATANPLRNTLFNFDLLAGACQLLTSPFDDLWRFELIEGTGMRSCAAYIFPFLSAPAHWPAIADAQYFREVPLRRPALLLAGRAYSRDEYVQLFASLPTPNPPEAIAYSLPITQPLLWTTRAPHGL
jgi:hypothetical protein